MLSRAIIIFSEQCNLSCQFCYSPFNGVKPSLNRLNDALLFCKDNDVSVLTFSGGDPFQYDFFREALRKAKAMGFIIHVDTNCCGIRIEDYALIESCVDIFGVPIDGDEGIHDQMRKLGHYRTIMDCLDAVIPLKNVSAKVNTVATGANIDSLKGIYEVVRSLNINLWSVYQYIPVWGSKVSNESFSISDEVFIDAVSALDISSSSIRVEVGKRSYRKHDYLFIQTDGTLLTHSPDDQSLYLTIGDIYSNDWKQRYDEINETMLPRLSQSRYDRI